MSRVTSPTTRFTVAEFERMVEADVFDTTRVELINGRVFRMPPQLNPHMAATSKVNRVFTPVVPSSEWFAVPGTLRFDRYTVVDPDLLWLGVPVGTAPEQWGSPILVIEISDRTYRKDSGVKLRKYAEFGIQDYWIVNLRATRVEIYRDPRNPTGKRSGCRYDSVKHMHRGETVSPLQRGNLKFRVDDLLP